MQRDARPATAPVTAMYQRQECIAQADACREKAQSDPARYDYWIDEARCHRGRETVTHEIHDGRMIPKRTHLAANHRSDLFVRRLATGARSQAALAPIGRSMHRRKVPTRSNGRLFYIVVVALTGSVPLTTALLILHYRV
jgi:hypothetical protein